MEQPSKKIITSEHFKLMMTGVRPGWRKILTNKKIKPVLSSCLKELATDLANRGVTPVQVEKSGLDIFIRPKVKHIFESMKYFDPQNLRVILVGQDPYLKPSEAHGLSFSVPKNTAIPKSSQNIHKALLHQDMVEEIPKHGNLAGWARQGVLLLNSNLTRVPNILKNKDGAWVEGNGDTSAKYMHNFWKSFTSELISYLTTDFLETLNHREHKIHVVLWGGPARALGAYVNTTDLPEGKTIRIHEWGHPSPLNRDNQSDGPQNFMNCKCFKHINEINWDPDFFYEKPNILMDQFFARRQESGPIDEHYIVKLYKKDPNLVYDDGTRNPENMMLTDILKKIRISASASRDEAIVVAVDGSCPGNGQQSDATASFGVYFLEEFVGSKTVMPNCSKIYGIVPNTTLRLVEDIKFIEGGDEIPMTNNRGEWLSAIYALSKIIETLREVGPKRVILITDSEYTLHFINERAWAGDAKKNPDMADIMKKLLVTLAKLVPNYHGGGSDGNEDTILSDRQCYDILIQPAGKTFRKEKKELDLHWPGLTVLHTMSHPEKKGLTIPLEGTKEYEMYLANEMADKLCENAINEKIKYKEI